MNKEIVIKNNFSVKSYTKAALNVLLPKWLIWSSVAIYSMLFIYDIKLIANEISSNQFNIDNLMRTEIFALFFPFFLYFIFSRSIKTKFKEDPKNKETIYHTLNNDYFEVKGDSFVTKYFWKDLDKIKEVKDFFLVFMTKNSFLVINKSDLKDNQYNELKELFNSIDIKKSLKS
jgi:uncharacterized membrane protein